MNWTAAWERKHIFNTQVVSYLERNICEASSGRMNSPLKGDLHCYKPDPCCHASSTVKLCYFSVHFPYRYGSPQQPLFKVGLSVFFLHCVFTSLNVLIYKERSYFLIAGKQRLLGSDSVLRTHSLWKRPRRL